jgi:flavin-dependent dehydrogenase
MPTHSPVLIIGGGPAGSATAIVLARSGIRPLLVERSREPHDLVCGGFVSGDALRILARLGVSLARAGARSITRIRLVRGGRQIEAPLPFPAVGLSRRVLDATLLQVAGAAGARIERGLSARSLEPGDRRVVLSDGTEAEPLAVFLATGKHDLRGAARAHPPHSEEVVGLRLRMTAPRLLARILSEVIELHLFADGYAGLLLQEDGSVNFCLSVSAARLRKAGGKPEGLLADLQAEAPLLAERFGAAERAGDWSSIARVPYGFRAARTASGVFRVGDQGAVTASLVGDGIGLALNSAGRASGAYLAGGPAAACAYQRSLSRRAAGPLTLASALRFAGESRAVAGPLFTALSLQPKALRLAARLTRV